MLGSYTGGQACVGFHKVRNNDGTAIHQRQRRGQRGRLGKVKERARALEGRHPARVSLLRHCVPPLLAWVEKAVASSQLPVASKSPRGKRPAFVGGFLSLTRKRRERVRENALTRHGEG